MFNGYSYYNSAIRHLKGMAKRWKAYLECVMSNPDYLTAQRI